MKGLLFVACLLLCSCGSKTYNTDDVIGEIIINDSSQKGCLNYEACEN